MKLAILKNIEINPVIRELIYLKIKLLKKNIKFQRILKNLIKLIQMHTLKKVP